MKQDVYPKGQQAHPQDELWLDDNGHYIPIENLTPTQMRDILRGIVRVERRKRHEHYSKMFQDHLAELAKKKVKENVQGTDNH